MKQDISFSFSAEGTKILRRSFSFGDAKKEMCNRLDLYSHSKKGTLMLSEENEDELMKEADWRYGDISFKFDEAGNVTHLTNADLNPLAFSKEFLRANPENQDLPKDLQLNVNPR